MKNALLITMIAAIGHAGPAAAQPDITDTRLLPGTLLGNRVAPELQSVLDQTPPGRLIPVLIEFERPRLDEVDKGVGRQARRLVAKALRETGSGMRQDVAKMLAENGATGVLDLWIAGAVAAKVPAALVGVLAARPGVVSIRLDGEIAAPPVVPQSTGAVEWNVTGIGADAMWAGGFTGQGATVGILDTGVDPDHPDLAAKWRAGGWFDPYGENSAPADPVGHGTHVAGVAVGGSAGGSALGVAPDAKWIAAKIFNDAGTASYSGIHAAFQWMLDPDGNPETDDAPDVVNGSWGLQNGVNACLREFEPDVAVLRAAQIAPVFAAGNTGPGGASSTSPANYPASISVGALDSADAAADFSARGPSACGAGVFPSMMAPGVAVKMPDLTFGGLFPDSYAYGSGTTLSAPHVAGALALLSSALPDGTVDQFVDVLQRSARDLGTVGADPVTGWGKIDVKAAYDLYLADGPTPGGGTGGGPVDGDGDGFVVADDCNDANAAIHPGAAEVKFDGVDQDCNGYDLTIAITSVKYESFYKRLTIKATSRLGGAAALQVAGYGPMKFDSRRKEWTLQVRPVAKAPASVTVTGVEGSTISAPGS